MSWENSSAITPLKRDFLKTFLSLEKRFFLTGGSALGLFYLQHRFSYDLDLFSTENFEWIDKVQVDTLHEIMLNKITTLISRCELKDIVDLYFLEKKGMRVETYFEEAQQKDGGLDPSMISLLLGSVAIVELPDYMIKPLTVEDLRAFVDDLKRRMALLAYPSE